MPSTGQAKLAQQRRRRAAKRDEARLSRDLFGLPDGGQGGSALAGRPRSGHPPPPDIPDDPAVSFREWAGDRLRIPTGPMAGRPFAIPDWQFEWVRAALADGVFEAGLSVARKNGKSGLIAAMLLAHMCGPLVRPGWRACVVSLTGNLAKELRGAMRATVRASGIEEVEFRETPPPGLALGPWETRVDFLAADKASGHAIGVDLAVVDEAGLLTEQDRSLWEAVLSSTSGRAGRLWAISIKGDGPMFKELEERRDDPAVHWTEYAAPVDASFDDEDAWRAANPGLGSIKSLDYLRNMSRRAMSNPAVAPSFAAYDLNLPQEPDREPIITVRQWMDCVVDDVPARDGPCFVGVDLGGSSSMTAAVAYWPETFRLETWGAFPGTPDLRTRGQADGVGGLYERMKASGELSVYPGRVTDIGAFLDDCASRLAGETVRGCAIDRYRKEEAREAFEAAGLTHWPVTLRGQGHSHTADGSRDVRAFQTAVLAGRVRTSRSLLMEAAITYSSIARDASGNPKLDKAKASGRIDALQAGVLALGMGERWRARPARRVYHGIAA